MQIHFSKRCADHDLCDLCRHEESIPGRMLCQVCLEAIARLERLQGWCSLPYHLSRKSSGEGGAPALDITTLEPL